MINYSFLFLKMFSLSYDMRFKLVGNQRASPNADVSPSQLCAVCQGKTNAYLIYDNLCSMFCFSIDTAQCQHYGVRTCEGLFDSS